MLCFQPRLSKETNVLDAKKSIKTVVSCFDLRTVAVALGIGPDELEGFRQSLENKTEKGEWIRDWVVVWCFGVLVSQLRTWQTCFVNLGRDTNFTFQFSSHSHDAATSATWLLAALGFLRPKPIGILGENWRYSGVESWSRRSMLQLGSEVGELSPEAVMEILGHSAIHV